LPVRTQKNLIPEFIAEARKTSTKYGVDVPLIGVDNPIIVIRIPVMMQVEIFLHCKV